MTGLTFIVNPVIFLCRFYMVRCEGSFSMMHFYQVLLCGVVAFGLAFNTLVAGNAQQGLFAVARETNIQRKERVQQLLFNASSCGDIKKIDEALSMGADINGRDLNHESQVTALMYSCINNHIDAARHLLQRGADSHMLDAWGWTAEDHLISDEQPSISAPKERVRLTAKQRAFKKRLQRMNHARNRARR
jgi:hypothetical protein